MALTSGTRLGPYEILAPIGAGGMGEVYKAKDTRLDRTVAIKVLPEHRAESPERKARFEREAKAISQLNHPHICTLYDVGEQDGFDFIVMEYIEGETLAERLKKGALPLDKALEYGIQIADGLDTAHRAGIIHRDLKPPNVMLTKSGVKLLDFGLARLVEGHDAPETSDAPTRQKDLTKEESIIGTLQYMAPEQLEGKTADARTDIFAFGAMLYEMVTGKKAFEGESQASLIGAILKDEPRPISALDPPALLERIVKTCLAKDPDRRWQSIADLRTQLGWVQIEDRSSARAERKVKGFSDRALFLAGTLLVGLLALLVGWKLGVTKPQPAAPMRLAIPLPEGQELDVGSPMALSPDGRLLVYAARTSSSSLATKLHVRLLHRFESEPIAGTDGAHSPFFSPDSQWIGFFTATELRKVAVEDGRIVTLCNVGDTARGQFASGHWARDGHIFFSDGPGSVVLRVSEEGGAPELIVEAERPQGEAGHGSPFLLPEGNNLLATTSFGGTPIVRVLELANRQWHEIDLGAGPSASARLLPTGHLVFGRGGRLLAAPFDPRSLETGAGGATPVIDGVSMDLGTGLVHYSVSRHGTLAYVPRQHGNRVLRLDRDGVSRSLREAAQTHLVPRLSPDGERLAMAIIDEGSGYRNIWVLDLNRGALTRLTFGQGHATDPAWSPDGKRIAFSSSRTGGVQNVFLRAADGSGDAVQLTDFEGPTSPTSWSRDGTLLFFRWAGKSTGHDIGVLRLDSEKTLHGREDIEIVLGAPYDELNSSLSPDGRSLAYTTNETGQYEVYVRPFPSLDRKWQISTEGGSEPLWAHDGRELFYRSGTGMMTVSIPNAAEFVPGKPRLLFEGTYSLDPFGRDAHNYDVASDGSFVMISDTAPRQIYVVLNWFEELQRLVPTDN